MSQFEQFLVVLFCFGLVLDTHGMSLEHFGAGFLLALSGRESKIGPELQAWKNKVTMVLFTPASSVLVHAWFFPQNSRLILYSPDQKLMNTELHIK